MNLALPSIKVNEILIDEALLACELQYHQYDDFKTVVQQAGKALVIRQLLLEQLDQKGLTSDPNEEDEAVQKLLDEVITYDDPSENDCLDYFKNNPGKFMSPTLMDVDHILLSASENDLSGRKKAKRKAYDLIERLTKNPLLFAALAEQYSACPSRKAGGFLGQVSKGQMESTFEQQLMLLSEGLAKEPIESNQGFHVVNIHRKIEGDSLDYKLMAGKVHAYLKHRAANLAIQSYIWGLVESANIEGIDLTGPHSLA